jgi:hypothetical protein
MVCTGVDWSADISTRQVQSSVLPWLGAARPNMAAAAVRVVRSSVSLITNMGSPI